VIRRGKKRLSKTEGDLMKAVVGSKNPVKIAAARAVLHRVYGQGVGVEALDVDSGVPDQPWGDEETLRGARQRAEAALRAEGAALGVGLEAGLVVVGEDIFTCAWCVVMRRDGTTGVAGGANLLLPPAVAEAVRVGAELGPSMDALTGLHNTKQGRGAIGILTRGYLDRQSSYEHLLTLAMARLLTPGYYEEGGLGG
jgi:inosine/xanthosine triphosphatase